MSNARKSLPPSLALALALAAAAMLTTVAAFAGPGPRGPQQPAGDRLAQRLGLNDAQAKKVKALVAKHRAATAPLQRSVLSKRAELRTLWRATPPSKSAILAKHGQLHTATDKLERARIAHRLDVLGVLTPEQGVRFLNHGTRRGGQRGMRAGQGNGRHQRKGQAAGQGCGQGCGHGGGHGGGAGSCGGG